MTTLSKEDDLPAGKIDRRKEIRELESKCADLVAENERLKAIPMKYRRMAFNAELQDENDKLRTALAAAEADNKRLRNHLSAIPDCTYWENAREIVRQALAQPRDDSVLREMVAGVYEECAKYFDERANWEMFGDRVADDIRALAEKARHGS